MKKRREEIENNITVEFSKIDNLLSDGFELSIFEAYEKTFINIRNAYNAKVTSGSERSVMSYINSRGEIYDSLSDCISTIRRLLFLLYKLKPSRRKDSLLNLKNKIPPQVFGGVILSEPSFFQGKTREFFEDSCGVERIERLYQLNLWAQKAEKILNRKRIEQTEQ